MKTRTSSRRRGFTLIELLVVIAIIAVLAAAGFAAGTAAINRAKRLKALAAANAVESAVNEFYREYGRLPDVGEMLTTDTGRGVELVVILMGKEPPTDRMQNSKALNFLGGMREGKAKKDGLIFEGGGSTPTGLFDPWGNGYEVTLDADYDEEITDPLSSGTVLRGRRVLVWSKGADKKQGGTDDVKTW